MNKTYVIYGSSTGTCEDIASRIGEKLGLSNNEIINVAQLTAAQVNEAKNLILGTSTWGSGELQDDWYDGLKTLQSCDLKGKTVALFGCGDSESYSDTFCGAMSELYKGIKDSGAKFIGSVSTDGYTYSDSDSVIDNKFIGLALDDVNESDKTDARIEAWVNQIKPEL
ncbi:MAG: flavodoxin FldA [Prevotella sp.]|jgi:flavodoxin I|uniref:Flavodoxin n=1 Tax=Segatella cerevisiae TaxID=2053716 RepID=A0ABT1BVD6_9BACT|nr:flavodoxin FldA [Segatella cerevisiae]MCH3995981.1 flavodoxin FldA [Prevotella sp.]MCI1246264.1 flavodoxin FldA [Prevotella sp.]MCO6025058.1 flavodoxin FldA [Segatella cerevisiae]